MLHRFQKNNSKSSCNLQWTNLNKLFFICGNLLKIKTLAKEKCLTQLHSVFFINIIKDLQCIYPPKICMKCYDLMNTASKSNSTFSPKTYENWCPQDDHLCRTCVRVAELCKGAFGKIKNTSRNYRRGPPSLILFPGRPWHTQNAHLIYIYIYIYIYICRYIYIYVFMYV